MMFFFKRTVTRPIRVRMTTVMNGRFQSIQHPSFSSPESM
jgi:hypothetical protein